MDRLRKFIADVLSTYHEFGIVDRKKIEKFLDDNKNGYIIIETEKFVFDDRLNFMGISKSYDEPSPLYRPHMGTGIGIQSAPVYDGITIIIYRPLKRSIVFSSLEGNHRDAESSSLKKILFFEDETSARLFYEVNKNE